MEKLKGSLLWLEAGYDLFAKEGLNGIQVERLARILGRNKSGFYHYFGDMDTYCSDLVRLHRKKADEFHAELRTVKSFDPEYLHLLVKTKVSLLFHIQCCRTSSTSVFQPVANKIDQETAEIVNHLWADFLGFDKNSDVALRYFNMVREMFYARATHLDIEYPYLLSIATETKVLAQQIANEKISKNMNSESFDDVRKVG